jgi:UDP-galactopyranose mutase
VQLIEKRTHVAGNMFDKKDERGILIQRYGPHFLNTNHYYVIDFLKQYSELFEHNTKLLSHIDGEHIRLPFNFESAKQLAGVENAEPLLAKLRTLRSKMRDSKSDRIPMLEMINSDDKEVSEFAVLLFEKAYKTYTSKMWGVDPAKIDKYVLDRVPFALNYDERYLNADFQYLPTQGFTALFENMLDHRNIHLHLNTDALAHLKLTQTSTSSEITFDGEKVDCLIFTGPIDELFVCKFGTLPYRSLNITYDYSDSDSVLPSEIVSYPQAEGYTRKTEYKKMMYDASETKGSVVATEYPLEYNPNAKIGNIPYYPVLTDESKAIYAKYLQEATKFNNLFLCGRLAEFKYYNMDICIEHALKYFEQVRDYLLK